MIFIKKFAKISVFLLSACMISGVSAQPVRSAENLKQVYLGGQPFGVRFFSDGVMVIELKSFYSNGALSCPAREAGVEVNDVIKKVNGTEIKTNEELAGAIKENGDKPIKFTIERNGKELSKTVTPKIASSGGYLLGAWVRDSCAGIGTVTYYDSEDKSFAALGHGICDADTSALMPLGNAEVVKASISSVNKSTTGVAGSLNGYFSEKKLGELSKNTNCGVFGTAYTEPQDNNKMIEIAGNDEITTGEAKLYTTLEGESPACYEVKITRILDCNEHSNENFVIKVTDSKLLEKAGGIVQGMSGSPIVQNGKLVGAVTHVFLNNTDEGYGITAQNMVSNCES